MAKARFGNTWHDKMDNLTVIGIDPGSLRTGWGIVRESSGQLELIACGIIRSSANAVAAGDYEANSFAARLVKIFTELTAVLDEYKPGAAAIEQLFASKNIQSALKLGQARGVAVAACANRALKIWDYEPTLVKKSLTGVGRAEKEQVAYMVCRLLNIRESHWPLDTTDALAVAICHLDQCRLRARIRLK